MNGDGAAAERDERFVDDLRAIRARIGDAFSLCGFLGVAEREVLVQQTVVASVNNLETRGEPFSFDRLAADGPHAQNSASLRWLLEQGLLRRDRREGQPVLFPTRTLLDRLMAFFGEERT